MKQAFKRIFTAGAVALAVAGGAFATDDEDESPENNTCLEGFKGTGIPSGDGNCTLAGIFIDCNNRKAIVTIFKGRQRQFACNIEMPRCDPGIPAGTKSDLGPSCLGEKPLMAFPDSVDRFLGSCTTCSTVKGVRKCFTNKSFNC